MYEMAPSENDYRHPNSDRQNGNKDSKRDTLGEVTFSLPSEITMFFGCLVFLYRNKKKKKKIEREHGLF